jgi:molybdate transport system substrate-binding protein
VLRFSYRERRWPPRLRTAPHRLLATQDAALEIQVLSSNAFKEAYLELVPQFEKATGHKVITTFEPTVAIMQRMAGGESYDLVVMSSDGIEKLTQNGKLVAGSRVDLAKAGIAAAVRAGAPRPDISSGEALKRALRAAHSIGYSTGPSGIYLEGLFRRMGIAETIKPRVKVAPPGVFIGTLIVKGDVELGFQQMSELLPIAGLDILGHLPSDVQNITTFAVGQHVGATAAEAARALVTFLKAPDGHALIRRKGLEPA